MRRQVRVRLAVVVLAVVLVSACSGEPGVFEASGHELWGPPSEAEVAAARELQRVYAGGGTDVFPPIDPDAPCPEDVPDGDTYVVVYRVRRGCLWSQQAHEAWILDSYRPDIERYFESDPFIVAVHNEGMPRHDGMELFSHEVLTQADEYSCHRSVWRYRGYGNIDRWGVLERGYRRGWSPQVVVAPFWGRFPWHEGVPACPPWVARAPAHLTWGWPSEAEAASARELQAGFVGRPPDEWPLLPDAPFACPAPTEPDDGYGQQAVVLRVFRFRRGCLTAEWGLGVRGFLPGTHGPWEVYDYGSDPWAIWACVPDSESAESVGCGSGLPHNARIAELLESYSSAPNRIDLGEQQ
ncbi:hypothetical protein [Candidatus Poriferisodalis sp.]|uniref:hypothetical protein n=1 Tax=Candidatus Poriferisodalis sp. TaxID=3101277 RepID=UPI003B019B69